MFNILNLDNWPRKNTFNYYKEFEDPFFNVCANLNVTKLVRKCQASDLNFFAASMYASLKTVNALQAFRLRMVDEEVRDYTTVHGGTTVLRPDHSFAFCNYDYSADADEFMKEILAQIKKAKAANDFDPADEQLDVIHYSSLPWVSFTNIKHARRVPTNSTIPMLVFGKYFLQNGEYLLPFSLEAHHALVDGWHVGQYFELFQKNLDEIGA